MRNLLISLAGVALLATISLGWLFDTIYEQYQGDSRPVSSVELAESIGQNLSVVINDAPNGEMLLQHWPSDSQYRLSIASMSDAALPQALVKQLTQGEVIILETESMQLFHYFLEDKNQVLIVESPRLSQLNEYTLEQYLLTLSFYVLLIVLFLMWAYPLLQQLSRLRRAAKAFGNGQLDTLITSKSTSYIRDIEIEFNQMAKRINSLMDDVKLLSTAVSHDLRTPLARIRFGIDTLTEVEDEQQRARLQHKLGKDVDEMTSLVEALLNFARLEQQTLVLDKTKIALVDVINECIDNKHHDSVQITFECKAPATVLADQHYLKMALNNVIQNAINYGNGLVSIELTTQDNSAVITVCDDGNGIPADIRNQITKPFIRGANSTAEHKGHGVGLAIVKRVLDWHDGTLCISNSTKLSGAEFTLVIPITK